MVRGPFTEKMFGPVLYDAFRKVKRAFDSDGLFNPGKIIDTPPLTANLRYGAGYRTPDPPAYFDFTDHGGLGRAVEMCSGLGVCRKTLDGTMCPSYMATREEKHSTRGRANTLRLAMAGRLGDAGLGDRDIYDVLDLCLECRACKAECPVGVDVGRFKSEFLTTYWKTHGLSMRARAVGHVGTMLKIGSMVPALANAVTGSRLGRRLGETIFGIDRRRTFPSLARDTFRSAFAHRAASRSAGLSGLPGGREAALKGCATTERHVLLFADTFTNYCHPEIGLAAADVLVAAGMTPQLAPHVCCGRPLISQGLLDEARALASANVSALFDVAARGTPIVFLEPSCLSAIREDVPDLLRGDAQQRARTIAGASVLFEEFVSQRWEAGTIALPLRRGPSTIALHGHCHQKAMGLLAPARALLARIPSATVVDLDAGCCGMAGSFGYARDHYDVSQAIGERRLLPAARALKDDAVLVASGTSCREQVAHFTGVTALHPAVLLRSLLDRHGDAR
jgi:Fe-S oxidoreductase